MNLNALQTQDFSPCSELKKPEKATFSLVSKRPLVFVIKNWWWEDKYDVTDEAISAVIDCFTRFCSFLNSSGLSDDSCEKIFCVQFGKI